jgi:osmotically-inducible protein OsmY
MKTDAQIKQDVIDQLKWQNDVDETQIGVTVKDGLVTLTGLVFSYPIKLAVEDAVKKVAGVKAIAEDIKVGYLSEQNKTDTEIANSVLNAIEWNASIPNDRVLVEVENGWITLSGTLEYAYQRDAAKRTVEYPTGVKGVTNNIILKQVIDPKDVQEQIKNAFERSALIDAQGISIETSDHAVKLKGRVRSIIEKEEAQKAAFNAPGVYAVQNELKVVS